MKKYNWVAQNVDGMVIISISKPSGVREIFGWSYDNHDFKILSRGRRNPNWKESLIDLSKNDYIIKGGILMATRKHAALIHAWADGAEIQFKNCDDEWDDCTPHDPCWDDVTEYRIKPKTKTVKFRNYFQHGNVRTLMAGDRAPPLNKIWLGDWQEVEIEL